MSVTSSAVRAAAALASSLVLLAGTTGCEESGADSVAEAVRGTLEMRGQEVEDVTCPSGLELEDDSVTCQVTIGGEDYPVEVTSSGSGGRRGTDIEVDDSQLP